MVFTKMFHLIYLEFCPLKFNMRVRYGMALIEPMHCNQPNITLINLIVLFQTCRL